MFVVVGFLVCSLFVVIFAAAPKALSVLWQYTVMRGTFTRVNVSAKAGSTKLVCDVV